MGRSPRDGEEIICRCNNIDRQTIENAICNGAKTLNEIFDATTAGVGPCGGSCRRKLGPLLEGYLRDGKFPAVIKEDMTGKAPKPQKAQLAAVPTEKKTS